MNQSSEFANVAYLQNSLCGQLRSAFVVIIHYMYQKTAGSYTVSLPAIGPQADKISENSSVP
jgi:hypothetical protein